MAHTWPSFLRMYVFPDERCTSVGKISQMECGVVEVHIVRCEVGLVFDFDVEFLGEIRTSLR